MSYQLFEVVFVDAFCKSYPELEFTKAVKAVDSYLTVVMPYLLNQFVNFKDTSYNDQEFIFEQDKIRKQVGQVTINGTRYWTFNLLQQQSDTRLIDVTFPGSKGRNSRAVLNPLYQARTLVDLGHTATYTPLPPKKEIAPITDAIVVPSRNQQPGLLLDNEKVVTIPVYEKYVLSYIVQSQRTLPTYKANEQKKKETVLKNIAQARSLLEMIHTTPDGEQYVTEVWKESDAGRTYGQGLSLQRVSTQVRNAALGICHKYDFKCCSFALMAGLAKVLDPSLKIETLLNYVQKREPIRIKLAKVIAIDGESKDIDNVYLIKRVFTSLGFGAKVINNYHHSIRQILGKEKFERLVADPLFITIREELDLISKTIIDSEEFSTNDFVIGNKTYESTAVDGSKRNNNQKLAWIYQALESLALNDMITIIKEIDDVDPILTVHDCLYFTHPLSTETTKDLHYLLQQKFPYLAFEHEKIIPIHTDELHQVMFSEQPEFEAEHKARIAEETRIANNYRSTMQITNAINDADDNNDSDYVHFVKNAISLAKKTKQTEEYEVSEEYEYEYEYNCNETITNY